MRLLFPLKEDQKHLTTEVIAFVGVRLSLPLWGLTQLSIFKKIPFKSERGFDLTRISDSGYTGIVTERLEFPEIQKIKNERLTD
ncbi:MAG TPA: hypothetical protein PKD94_12335 [Ignavibacteria bacterium]|nr:hypothetical protein [Ignavibacteria bacterium]